jgi:hypothetical protein
MFPPRDPTRRRFLAVAAVASVVSAGTLAAAALAPDVPRAVTVPNQGRPDPIYVAIEAHRKAYATMQTTFAEHRQAYDLADAKVGPAHLEIPSMVDPGETVEASFWWDIERAIPSRQYPELYGHYNRLLEERQAARAAIIEPLIGDEDEATEKVAAPELEALRHFEDTAPITLVGLLAMIIYAGEINDQNADAFDRSTPIFENMATAAAALARVQS